MRWRYLIFALLIGCATVNKPDAYGTGHDDSNTVNSLSNLNPALTTYGGSAYPGQLYNSLSKEDANRWSEQGQPFQNWVSIVANANACLGTTSAGLVMTPTSCIAYNAGYRATETHGITFGDNRTCWVAMDENTSGSNANLPNFTRVQATHYLIDCIDPTQPAMVADSQILMKVVTTGGAITAVTDLRHTMPIVQSALSSVSITATSPVIVTPSPLTGTGVISLGVVPPANGGTGGATLVAHEPVIGEGTSPAAGVAMAVDTFLQGQGASADPTAGVLPACALDGAHALGYASHAFGCTPLAGTVHGQSLFTNSGTYTVPAGVSSVTFECWGPGGGGGGYGAAATNGSAGSAATTAIGSGPTTECSGGAGQAGSGALAGAVGTGGNGGNAASGILNVAGTWGWAGVSPQNNNAGTNGGGSGGFAPGMGYTNTSATIGQGGPGGGDGAGHGAGGGGGGGYSKRVVSTTPASTFAITIGAFGNLGTGGTFNGQPGQSGAVLVTW